MTTRLLTSDAGFTTLDNFAEEIDAALWQEVSHGEVNSSFGHSSLFFTGGSVDGSRHATTTAINLEDAGFISFDLIFGNGVNGGEDADWGEDVALEYSLDNGDSWIELALFDTEDYTTWSSIAVALPSEAQTTETQLRWRQIRHSGGDFDSWGLDNVATAAEETNFAPLGNDASFTVAENIAANSFVGQVVATDPNPEQFLTYSISSGNTEGAFEINPAGKIFVANEAALDYETTPSFSLEVEISDSDASRLSSTVTVDIDLIDLYEGETISSLYEDFEPSLNLTQWEEHSSSKVNSKFGGSGNALYFTGGEYKDDSRYLTTGKLNLSNGGEIAFDLIFGNGVNGGDNADSGEDVALEYSLDNGDSWERIALYDTEEYTSWTGISEQVPATAYSAETLLRWSQVQHGGSSYDNWALDNIAVDPF